MKRIKLAELIEALEFDSDERLSMIDLQEGCVVTVNHSVMRAVEEEDEEALGNLPEWQQAEIEIARAMMNDSGERFVDGPDKTDFHEYREMERFIGTVEDAGAAEQLWRAIKGQGAFRHFKDTASRLGLLQEWYLYRDTAVKEYIVAWAEACQIPIVDDVKPG